MGDNLKQAEKHMKDGKKALTKSFMSLRFSPDYTTAAIEFGQAASCFQAAGRQMEAVDAFIACADARSNENDQFLSSRSLEMACQILEKAGKVEQAIPLWERAVMGYRLSGKLDLSIRLKMKIAGALALQNKVEVADEMYADCIEDYQGQDQYHYASEIHKERIAVLAKSKKLERLRAALDAHTECLVKLKQLNMAGKNAVAQVVVCLALDDDVAADQALAAACCKDSSFVCSNEHDVRTPTHIYCSCLSCIQPL